MDLHVAASWGDFGGLAEAGSTVNRLDIEQAGGHDLSASLEAAAAELRASLEGQVHQIVAAAEERAAQEPNQGATGRFVREGDGVEGEPVSQTA